MCRKLIIVFFSAIVALTYCHAYSKLESKSLCSVNSELSLCGTLCEPTCTNRSPKFCPRIQCSHLTSGCRCKNGFLRDSKTKECVPPILCSECPIGQIRLPCGELCEGTCARPYLSSDCKITQCLIPSCGCDLSKGYVRSKLTKTCVLLSNCYCPASKEKKTIIVT